MKRTAIALTLIMALLVSAVAGTLVVNLGKTNPEFFKHKYVPPPDDMQTPTIRILSPANNSVCDSNKNLTISFNVFLNKRNDPYNSRLLAIYCRTSWQEENSVVFSPEPWVTQYSGKFNFNLTGISTGRSNITITAGAWGGYREGYVVYDFSSENASSSIIFIVRDTTPPRVSVLSMENKTYNTSDIPLNFTVSEPASQTEYSIDGQENVTISGNTTLTGLADGDHNVTVYAKDKVGNVGASETVNFTIAKETILQQETASFPIVPFAAASVASLAVVAAGLMVYFKKRKHVDAKQVK